MDIETIKTTIMEVTQALQPLTEKLGTSAEYLFKLSVRQVYVSAATTFLFVLIVLGVDYAFYRFLKWGLGKDADNSHNRFYYHDELMIITIISGMLLGIGTIASILGFLIDIPQAVLNPEWQAVKNIMNLITPKN